MSGAHVLPGSPGFPSLLQDSTHRYLEADLAMKERALRALQEPPSRPLRFRATDKLLGFLDGL